MLESRFWNSYFKEWLDNEAPVRVEYTRHEDEMTVGIPDVSYSCPGIHGWIELKALHNWPKRESTPVRFPKFKPAQRRFLVNRGELGGFCFFMAVVERDVIVIDWSQLEVVGELNKEGLVGIAQYYHKLPLQTTSLAPILFNRID